MESATAQQLQEQEQGKLHEEELDGQQHYSPAPLWQQALLVGLCSNIGHLAEDLSSKLPRISSSFVLEPGISVEAKQVLMGAFANYQGAQRKQPSAHDDLRQPQGMALAKAAIQQHRPRLLSWVLQQPLLWAQPADEGDGVAGPDVNSAEDFSWSIAGLLHATWAHADCCPLTAPVSSSCGCCIDQQPCGRWSRPGVQDSFNQGSSASSSSSSIRHACGSNSRAPAAAAEATAAAQAAGMSAAADAGALPCYARMAVDTAMLLLRLDLAHSEGLLDGWIRSHIRAHSRPEDILRTKAVLAAVAAAPEVPVGARVLHKPALLRVLETGDIDLLAMLLMVAARLELAPGRDGLGPGA